jgi:hypothetical protein
MNIEDWRTRGPAYFLWLLREKKVGSAEDFVKHFFGPKREISAGEDSCLRSHISEVIGRLTDAGLIEEEKGGTLKTTSLLPRIQSALELSLTEFAERPQFAIWVNPLFGPPVKRTPSSDLFVLMPFSLDLKPVFDDHIKKVASQLDLSVRRADDFFTAHAIIEDIWNAIYSSKLIIADCTGRNPNVFYEIGVAHTLGKKVILVTQSLDDVPFDLRYLRVIRYDFTPRGMRDFEDVLFKTIQTYLVGAEVARGA